MANDPRIKADSYADGRKRYRIRWREADGKHIRATFGRYDEAKAKLDEVNSAKAGGTYTSRAGGRQRLSDYFSEWFQQSALEESTRALYEVEWRLHIGPELGSIQLAKLNRPRVKQWIADMRNAGVGARTIGVCHGLLRAVLAEAVTDGKIASNPAAKVTVPDVEKREMRPLDAAQLAALADAVPARDRALVLLLGYGGLRIGEAAALRVGDLDLMRGSVTISRSLSEVGGRLVVGSTKTDRARTVRLPRFLVDELTAHLAAFGHPGDRSSLVFTTASGSAFRLNNWRRRTFGPAQVRASISPPIRIHDLRHTAAALAIQAGAHPKAIQEMLGHADIGTTLNTYGHMLPSLHETLADKLDETYREAAARPSAAVFPIGS